MTDTPQNAPMFDGQQAPLGVNGPMQQPMPQDAPMPQAAPVYAGQQMPFDPNNPMQPAAQKTSGFSIAGLVLGAVSLIISWIPYINYFALLLAIVGLVFAILGLVQASKGTHAGKGLAIAGLIISVIAMGVMVITSIAYSVVENRAEEELRQIEEQYNQQEEERDREYERSSGDATDDVLKDSLDVTLGTFQIKEGEYHTETKLPVTLKNKLDESKSFSITIEAADANGNRLTTDIVMVDKLGPGQSYSEDAFSYVSQKDIAKYKNATFKIIEAREYSY